MEAARLDALMGIAVVRVVLHADGVVREKMTGVGWRAAVVDREFAACARVAALVIARRAVMNVVKDIVTVSPITRRAVVILVKGKFAVGSVAWRTEVFGAVCLRTLHVWVVVAFQCTVVDGAVYPGGVGWVADSKMTAVTHA